MEICFMRNLINLFSYKDILINKFKFTKYDKFFIINLTNIFIIILKNYQDHVKASFPSFYIEINHSKN